MLRYYIYVRMKLAKLIVLKSSTIKRYINRLPVEVSVSADMLDVFCPNRGGLLIEIPAVMSAFSCSYPSLTTRRGNS
jgi:hypothetical protein